MPRRAIYGQIRTVVPVTVPFVGFLNGTGQVNFMLSKSLGFEATLEKVEIVTTTVGTGAGATQILNVRKGNATGAIIGTVTATLANQGTLGVVTLGTVTTAPVGNDKFLDGDTLTIERPAGGTAFTAGGLELILTFRAFPQRPV